MADYGPEDDDDGAAPFPSNDDAGGRDMSFDSLGAPAAEGAAPDDADAGGEAAADAEAASSSAAAAAPPPPPDPPRRAAFGMAMDASQEDTLLSVPAFANAANRALNDKLVARNRALARSVAETREHQERAGVMQEHLKHIRAELTGAQRVVEAKAKELQTEEHLSAMAERSLGRARQDMAALDGRLEEARAQLGAVQAGIAKGAARLEAFKADMNWKQEELEKWGAAAKAREADARALDECVALPRFS